MKNKAALRLSNHSSHNRYCPKPILAIFTTYENQALDKRSVNCCYSYSEYTSELN